MLDLFGTLVPAPSPAERTSAAALLAEAVGRPPAQVEQYLVSTWPIRHSTLASVPLLTAHLIAALGARPDAAAEIEGALRELASRRLVVDESVAQTLHSLRGMGLRLAVLSDASADIADRWPASALAELVDVAVFSCRVGRTKPDPRLYSMITTSLDVPADQTLFVGDGGGDELHGALRAGMAAVAVRRRGPADALVFGSTEWAGPVVDTVQSLPAYLFGT